MTARHRLSLERIAQAATVIDPVFLNSPQYLAETLSERLGCRVVVKVETLNPIRSFKGRGAEYYVSTLFQRAPQRFAASPSRSARAVSALTPRFTPGQPHLVCATAGNFGQGLAYAARKRRLPITIFVAADANPLKVERMRAMGADVRLVNDRLVNEPPAQEMDGAAAAAREFAREKRAQLVQDGRDVAIGEGAGTIGMELLRWPGPFDAILVPLGDGSLLAGIARWVKAHRPATQMIGVCPQSSPAMERSWRVGRVLEVPSNTIADGLAVSSPYPEALADITGPVDDIVLCDDRTTIEAMRLAHQELGIVLEPSGAAGVAALMTYRERFQGKLVGVILTGGNVTAEQIRKWFIT